MSRRVWIGWVLMLLPGPLTAPATEPAALDDRCRQATERALAFLEREVPQWSQRNQCYSCHNNGDGARALYTAARLGWRVARATLADTNRWLARPDRWNHQGGDREFSDHRLAAIQFAAALAAAGEAHEVGDRQPLQQAAAAVAAQQSPDGSWAIDAAGTIGSPTTYGRYLATALAVRVLTTADPQQYVEARNHARTWLQTNEPRSVVDAAAWLLAVVPLADERFTSQFPQRLTLLREGQNPSGGWGPFASSAAEPFDTAVVLLALTQLPDRAAWQMRIDRGRCYLIELQEDDGSWPETTRPAGAESYAQRISTSAWVTLALLATTPRPS